MGKKIQAGSRVKIHSIPKGWYLEGNLEKGQMDTVIYVTHDGNACLSSYWFIPKKNLRLIVS